MSPNKQQFETPKKQELSACSYLSARITGGSLALGVATIGVYCGFLWLGRRCPPGAAARCCHQQDRSGITGAKAQSGRWQGTLLSKQLFSFHLSLCHLRGRAELSLVAGRFLHSSNLHRQKDFSTLQFTLGQCDRDPAPISLSTRIILVSP